MLATNEAAKTKHMTALIIAASIIFVGAEAFAKPFVDEVNKVGHQVAALFRNAEFAITDFGARQDGTKCTDAFAAAFAAAERAGGGRVTVPQGRWTTGAIRFRSNCELHLDDGAEVVFSQDPADYLPAVFTSWEGMECVNYCPLVYAYGCTNVAITGTGTLRAFDGKWEDTAWYPWVPQANGVKAARLQLYTWGATDFPVEKREIWKMENAHTRPHFIQFNRCKNVRLDGFRVRNSPFWTIHLYQCEDASVRGLDVYAHGNNNDGIDIEMSRNVLVEKCVFDQGDDGVVIKSGRNRDAWRIGKPTENVLVRDCEIRNAHTVLGIGSEISGGVRNVLMKDCTAGDVNRVFFVKTNRRRGGELENIACENVSARSAKYSLFEIATDILYEWANFPDYENRTTRISDIRASRIFAETALHDVIVAGDPSLPPSGVRWSDVKARATAGERVVLKNAGDAVELDAVADCATGELSGKIAEALAVPQCVSCDRMRGTSVYERYYNEIVKRDILADEAWESLKSHDEFAARQRRLREGMVKAIGGFPEKTPLNLRVVETVRRDGYSVEKILFESRPSHHVTAHRFVPDKTAFPLPRPGIVVPCGHSLSGKLAPWYQRAGVVGAQAGFVTIVYDPIDQGERRQTPPDADGEVQSPVHEHNRCGKRAALLGWSAAQFRIWDGMCAIDVLCEDSRVDRSKVCVYGISGGGTLTSYIMALDDRVAVACPAAFLSTMRSVCDHAGPQDAEQNIFGQLAFGLNHLGFVLMRAPSPVLMCCTHSDFFPFGGALETAERARRAYAALGAGENFSSFDVGGPHHWYESERQASLAWMKERLGMEAGAYSGNIGRFKSLDVAFSYSSADIALADVNSKSHITPAGKVTDRGYVLDIPGERSVYDIMREEAERAKSARPALTPESVRSIAAIDGEAGWEVAAQGECKMPGLLVRSTTLVRPDGVLVPTVTFLPEGADGDPAIVVSDSPRTNLVAVVESLIAARRPVMVAELRAFGETGANRPSRQHGFYRCKDGDEEVAVMCIWLGRSLVGDRAGDLAAAATMFAGLDEVGGRKIEIVAQGRASVPAAHAFYVWRKLFSGLKLERPPQSWESLFADPMLDSRFADVVHGAYRFYDWTGLLSTPPLLEMERLNKLSAPASVKPL